MIDWSSLCARRVEWVTSSVLGDMLRMTERGDVISFSGGLPAPEQFPIERFRQAADFVLSAHGQQALQYSPTEGYSPLRHLIAGILCQEGVTADESNVLITAGSQQAMELLGRLLLERDDPVLVESPTYVGALQAFGIYHPRFTVVPNDQDGVLVDQLGQAMELGPKFIYLLPNFQNPSGTTLPEERRRELVALTLARGVPIVEDDPYSQLRYEGDHIPSLIALEARNHPANGRRYNGHVLYHSTFSKVLAPGLRIGWIVAPQGVIQELTRLKQAVDLHTSTFTQMVAYEVARDGFLDEHVQQLRRLYEHRRGVMLESMAKEFPANVSWTRPQGGLFILVTMPDSVDAKEILVDALKQRVAIVPGAPFFPDGRGHNTFRLNFSSAKPDRIIEGIRRLGKILRSYCSTTNS